MRRIPLTKGLFALVSEVDYARVNQFKWCASLESRNTKWYAVRKEKGKKIRMHHFVLGVSRETLPHGHVVDHHDHNGLNNTRENLSIITQRENMLKSPGWKRCAKLQKDKNRN